MKIWHIALQGCLKGGGIDYGCCPDTGGHIKYLLDLCTSLEAHQPELEQVIVTRRFESKALGSLLCPSKSPPYGPNKYSPTFGLGEELPFQRKTLATSRRVSRGNRCLSLRQGSKTRFDSCALRRCGSDSGFH